MEACLSISLLAQADAGDAQTCGCLWNESLLNG